MTKRCKLVGFDFDIGDWFNIKYVQYVIPCAVVDVEAGQSLEEGFDERLCDDVDGV